MRLSEWRKTAPTKESISSRVLAVVRPVLVDLGAEADAECWVVWGDDPESRYSILAPTAAGLGTVAVRLTGAEGTRATAKLTRWSKLSVSELSVEASGGHRLVAVQVESLILKGVDAEADRICDFVLGLIAGIDGRNTGPMPIAIVQGAAVGAGVVLTGVGTEAAAIPPASPGPSLEEIADGSMQPSRPSISGPAAPKAVPSAPRAASKAAPKPAAKRAALALVPAPTPAPASHVPAPAIPVEPAAPAKPIADRAAAVQHREQVPTPPTEPAREGPESDVDRSEWVGPHPIEEPPAREPNRPRPWAP